MMPETLYLDEFFTVPSVTEALEAPDQKLPVALDNENVEAFCLDFSATPHLSVMGTPNCGKSNLIKVMLESFTRKNRPYKVILVDDEMGRLAGYRNYCEFYFTEKKEITELLEIMNEMTAARKDECAKAVRTQSVTPAQFYESQPSFILIINNVEWLFRILDTQESKQKLANLMETTRLTGIHMIFVSNNKDYPKLSNDPLLPAFRAVTEGFSYIPFNQAQGLPIPPNPGRFKPISLPGETYYIRSNDATLIRIPLVTPANEQAAKSKLQG
jgi:hypothetical protein